MKNIRIDFVGILAVFIWTEESLTRVGWTRTPIGYQPPSFICVF